MSNTDDQNTVGTETLLSGNRRLFVVNLTIGILVAAIAILTWVFALAWPVRIFSVVLIACSLVVCLFSCIVSVRPRVAINETELLVYLRKNPLVPYRVPLTVVEVFFIGQGAVSGAEPGQPKEYEGAVAANVIVRLAEAATDWHQRDVQQMLGVWNEGYITIRGLFCANIDQEVLKQMNKRLLHRKRILRKKDVPSGAEA